MATAPLVAALLGVSQSRLVLQPEGFSAKLPHTKAFRDHLDRNRVPTDFEDWQIVIACSAGPFSVWPGSHVAVEEKEKDVTYKFKKANHWCYCPEDPLVQRMRELSARLLIPAEMGDVLLFRGGRIVHGVAETFGNLRLATYAAFHVKPQETYKRAKFEHKLNDARYGNPDNIDLD
jgi:hypothetical protein